MAFVQYVKGSPKASTRAMISAANQIIAEYQVRGFTLTLRQLYYQFVSRGILANTTRNYKRLGSLINDGRLWGMIDWTAIEDRTRGLSTNAHWTSPKDIVESCVSQYRLDRWKTQPVYVEVWVEKEALSGVVGQICRRFDVPFLCCRGYVSQSEMYEAGAHRFRRVGKPGVVLYLGDHDPSGIDMTRDVRERLQMFSDNWVTVRRLALNRKQVAKYDPPPNPAKTTDSRFSRYHVEFGKVSWELDALDPEIIQRLIRGAVREYRDEKLWLATKRREERDKETLRRVAVSLGSENGEAREGVDDAEG